MKYKSTTAIGIFMVFIAGYFLFAMKRDVESLDFELSAIKKQVNNEKDTINLLKAEFTHLTSPDRIKILAVRYLKLANVTPEKMVIDPLKVEIQPTAQNDDMQVKSAKVKNIAEVKSPLMVAVGKKSVKWRYKHMGSRYAAIKTASLR